MKFFPHLIILLVTFAALLTNCESDPPKTTTETETTTTKKVPVPKFDRDSAVAFVQKQVDFGPRVLETEAHESCKNWLVDKFKSFGAEVIEQDFAANIYTGESLQATNIIAQYNLSAKKRILLAAHWDSRHLADSPISEERREDPILGADDGGSGVAVLLEIARQLGLNPIEMGVDIVLFDAEDYGESGANNVESWGLGSQYWSRNFHVKGYRPQYGILLDMVGSRGARFPVEQFSAQYAPQVVRKVWKLAKSMGYNNYFVEADGGAVTDDHYFVNTIGKIPMIDIINRPVGTQTGFGEYWHTHDDDMDIIDKRTLRAVGQVVLATIYRESNGDI